MTFRALLATFLLLMSVVAGASESIQWTSKHDDDTHVHLYFFWSASCPHCQKALPFIRSLSKDYAWLEVHSAEISQSRANQIRFLEIATALGQEPRSVPAFFVCGRMITGYDSPQGVGQEIIRLALNCRQSPGAASPATAPGKTFMLPFIGTIDPHGHSLLLFTVIIAGMDSFNPCAFFVLLFLLSLMVHARSRSRMLLIGITFVSISALVYFMFMAAWLNLFMMIGAMPTITLVAGLIAVTIGLLNTKDYFQFGQGPSLSIPASAKPSLFRRMRGLVRANRTTTILVGTAGLAIAANSYELLCTAGFPMVFTRLLTLSELSSAQYYAYLVLYNLVYVLPLMVIVLIFALTLGAYKLGEQQGRLLKLVSGLMMLGLGIVLLVAPDALLSKLWSGALLLLASVVIAAGVHWVSSRRAG